MQPPKQQSKPPNWQKRGGVESMNMTTCVLPDKPSELIRLALADLKKCEADKNYFVNMWQWHSPFNGKCAVCLAGAVMAQTAKEPINKNCVPGDGPHTRKYLALDAFREGAVHDGLAFLQVDFSDDIPENWEVSSHEVHPEHFHTDMESLAKLLEQHGL